MDEGYASEFGGVCPRMLLGGLFSTLVGMIRVNGRFTCRKI